MSGNNQYLAHQFIDVIPGTGGIISTIAKKVGCAWHTAKKYIDSYPTIAQAYTDECERVLDVAENVIVNSIEVDSDLQTAKWYMGMKGASRGYIQHRRQEVTGAGGRALTIVLTWGDNNADDDD